MRHFHGSCGIVIRFNLSNYNELQYANEAVVVLKSHQRAVIVVVFRAAALDSVGNMVGQAPPRPPQ